MSARHPKKNERTDKRKETIRKRQDETKAKFLSKLETMPVIQVAAARTGIDRSTYYRWRDADSEFKDRCFDALQLGNEFVNDMMESLLINSAKEGKIVAMIFWLKHHHKQYMEIRRYEHFHQHEFQESILTDERKQQIADSMRAWFESDDDEDERDEDYEVLKDKDGNIINPDTVLDTEKSKTETRKSIEEETSLPDVRPPKRKRIATRYHPKK